MSELGQRGIVSLRAIFVPQQVVRSSDNLMKKLKVDQWSILEEPITNQRRCSSDGSTLGVCTKLPELHDDLGALGHASAAHGLDLLQDSRLRTSPAAFLVSPLDITDRSVTSSRL